MILQVTFLPESPFSELFGSDRIFGAVVWDLADSDGSGAASKLVEDFRHNPPFLISSLMPQGYLPRPMLPLPDRDDESMSKKERTRAIDRSKKMKKRRWLSLEAFHNIQGNMSPDRLEEALAEDTPPGEFLSFRHTGTAIDRRTMTAREGFLFEKEYNWYRDGLTCFVRVRDVEYDLAWFQTIFERIGRTGIGRDRSKGKGSFRVEVSEAGGMNAEIMKYRGGHFVTCGRCAGTNLDPLLYTTVTRHGRVGGLYSQESRQGKRVIHKKPVVYYDTGSTFRVDEEPVGSMIEGTHPESHILQYAWAFPVEFSFHEEAK